MKYNALLFCPDEKTARVVTQVLTDLEFRVEPCNEPFAAVKKLMAEHFDAIVVDCDSEQNAALLFKSAHNSGSNQSSLAVAVVEGQTGVAKAFRIGANLVLTKPINVEQSKGTLRVARGLLRKTDATRPASATPSVATPATQPARPTPSIEPKRLPLPQPFEPRPVLSSLPVPPPPSSIPSVSNALFELEADPGPKPDSTEAALLESMADPAPKSVTGKEYPWQPVSKPAAEPMATALRRAAEATGRSDADSSATSQATPSTASLSDAPVSHSFTTGMGSGHGAAATAPAKIPSKPHEEEVKVAEVEAPVEMPAPAAASAKSHEPASASSRKTPLIAAAALIAAVAIAYVGWTKLHPTNSAPGTQLSIPQRSVPVQAPTIPSSPTPTQNITATAVPPNPASALPIERGPETSPSDTHPAVSKKSTSITVSNPAVKAISDDAATTTLVVKSGVANPAASAQPAPESAEPPALDVASNSSSNSNDQAISGIMNTTAVSLPRPVPQRLKVSQGVSQGLLIKSVDPVYPPVARQMHLQGAIQLQATIGKDGSITSVKLLNGDAVLGRAAMDAVKQWKYKPYYLDDQPVEIQTQVTVNFKLP